MSSNPTTSELSSTQLLLSLSAIPVAAMTFVLSCVLMSSVAPRRVEGVRLAADWPWIIHWMLPAGIGALVMLFSLVWVTGRKVRLCWCANFLMTIAAGTAFVAEWLHRDYVGKL